MSSPVLSSTSLVDKNDKSSLSSEGKQFAVDLARRRPPRNAVDENNTSPDPNINEALKNRAQSVYLPTVEDEVSDDALEVADASASLLGLSQPKRSRNKSRGSKGKDSNNSASSPTRPLQEGAGDNDNKSSSAFVGIIDKSSSALLSVLSSSMEGKDLAAKKPTIQTLDIELQIETTSSIGSRIIFYGWYVLLLLAVVLQVIIVLQWECRNMCGGECGLLSLDDWRSGACSDVRRYEVEVPVNDTYNETQNAFDLTWHGSVGYVADEKLTRFVHIVLMMPRPNVSHNGDIKMDLQFALNVSNVANDQIRLSDIVATTVLQCNAGESRCEPIFLNTDIAQSVTNTSKLTIVIPDAPKALADVSGEAGVAYVFQSRSYTIGTLVVRYFCIVISLIHLVRFIYHKSINGLYEQTWVIVLHFALFLFLDPLFAGGVFLSPVPSIFPFIEFRMPLYFIATFISFMYSVITSSHAWATDNDSVEVLYDPPTRTKLVPIAYIATIVILDVVDGYLQDWDWASEHCPDFKCSVPGFMMYILLGVGVVMCTCWLWWLRGNLGQKPYFACRAQQLAFRIFVLVFLSAVAYLVVQTILVFAIYHQISPLVSYQILIQIGPVIVLVAFVNIMTYVYTSTLRGGKGSEKEKGVPIRPMDPEWKETVWEDKWYRWLAQHGGSMYMFVSEAEEMLFDHIQTQAAIRREHMKKRMPNGGSGSGEREGDHGVFRSMLNHFPFGGSPSSEARDRTSSVYEAELEFTIPHWRLDKDLTPFERKVREYEMRMAIKRQAEIERRAAERDAIRDGFDLVDEDDSQWEDYESDEERVTTSMNAEQVKVGKKGSEANSANPTPKSSVKSSSASPSPNNNNNPQPTNKNNSSGKFKGGAEGEPLDSKEDQQQRTTYDATSSQNSPSLNAQQPAKKTTRFSSTEPNREESTGTVRQSSTGGRRPRSTHIRRRPNDAGSNTSSHGNGNSNPFRTVANFGRDVVNAVVEAPNVLGERIGKIEDGIMAMGYVLGGYSHARKPFFNLETCVDLFNLSWEVYGRPTAAADIYLITDAHLEAPKTKEEVLPMWKRLFCCFTCWDNEKKASKKKSKSREDPLLSGTADNEPVSIVATDGLNASSSQQPYLSPTSSSAAAPVGSPNGHRHQPSDGSTSSADYGVIGPVADITRVPIAGGAEKHFEGDKRPVDSTSKLAPPICTEQYGYELVAVHEALDVQMLITIMDTSIDVHRGKTPRICVSFRGSANASNFKEDVRLTRVRWTEMPTKNALSDKWVGPTVHQGFLNVWSALRHFALTEVQELVRHISSQMSPNSPPPAVYLTGHSLGGAVAILCAYAMKKTLRIEPTVYTFGGPIVGNKAFKEEYNREIPKTFRVVNESDMVVSIKFGGHHVGIEAAIDRMGNFICEPMFIERWLRPTQGKGLAAVNHMMAAYGASLNAIIEQGRFGECPIKCQKSYFPPSERASVLAIASRRKQHEMRLKEKESGVYDAALHHSNFGYVGANSTSNVTGSTYSSARQSYTSPKGTSNDYQRYD